MFLAVANQVLYALDEDTGAMLWAARVGPGSFDPPTVAQVQLPEGPTDLALVASDVGGKPALTAYVLRTGQPRWSQPLEPKVQPGGDASKLQPAPAAGAVVVAGSRAYVPIRDSSGSVLVFDIASGMKIGRITVGQSISPGAFLRPGTNHLYIAAESRRIFVFDIEAIAAGGDARCLRVIPTDHPTGSLRTIPGILGQPGDDPSPRFLILSQSNGAGMKLRAFPLPPTPAFVPDAPPALEPLPGGAIELDMNGWAWFPPVSDSERITVVTDRNQFRIFGIKQAGNNDDPLFPLPSPTIPEPPGGQPVRGLVVPAEEGAYWVLVGGALTKYRLTLVPSAGLTLVPDKAGLPIGEPTQPAQMNAKRDTACFVVRSANSSGCRAVAVKLRDGAPRWQRQLGLIPSVTPLRTDTGVLLVDGDAGAVAVPSTATAAFDPAWIVAPPINGVTKPAVLAASADAKTVFTISAVGEGAVAKWIIRRAVNGKFDHSGSVNAPGALAGSPVVFNNTLLLPASDGFIYRLVVGDGRGVEDKLAPGPKWLLNRAADNPQCYIAALPNDQFITSDGGRMLKRWIWPATGGWADDNASWSLRERVAAPPLILPAAAGKPARMIAADSTGSVTLFGLDRSDNLIRRWVPGVTAALPNGEVSPFAFQTDATGRMLVAYSVRKKQTVCLDADADAPLWITPESEESLVGSPVPLGAGNWLVTDLGGRVSVFHPDSPQPALTRDAGFAGAVPEKAAVPLDATRVLVPLSDGSAALVDIAAKK
ncbi:MAG: PQQ-binding-like beta-propeller repeat protein [Gemmataceae bacterium]